ncbi:MAG: carbohydrate-binding protein [Bacillota bacterium]
MNDAKIEVKPTPITAGEKVTISYNGLLTKFGAEEVYLHAGVGVNDSWRDITSIKMKKEDEDTWQAQLKINTTDRFNFCFKDSANNWDNNEGSNWSFEVHNGEHYNLNQ